MLKLVGFILLIPTLASCQDVQYARACAGSDIGAKITSCLQALPTASSGYKVGTIILPNTYTDADLAVWSTPVTLGPGVNLIGQGLFASSFHCSVAGDCLRHDASGEAFGSNAHSVLPSTLYQGFTITGNSAKDQNIFDFLDAQGVTVRDVTADGANEPGGACFWFQDVRWWTERNQFENVSTLYSCNIGWRFSVQPGNPNEPHPSFGYNRFLDIKYNTNGPQTAFSFENDSYVYSSTFRVTGNKGGVGSKIIHMQDGAKFYFNEVHFYGEENGKGGYLLDLTSPNNVFTYTGDVNFTPGAANNIAPGAIVTHWLDSWAYFNATGDLLGNPLVSQSNITWNQSLNLPSGTNLNTVTACGYYEGNQLIGGPPVSPAAVLLHIQVICAGAIGSGYFTQVAYQASYTKGNNIVWQRVRDNGTWGAWQEMPNPVSVTTEKVTVGSATWTYGNSGPKGGCSTGSLYSNTSGTSGSTLYVCVNSTWTNIK